MATLSDDAAVRRLADRFGFGRGGDALAAAQRDGFDTTLSAYLEPSGDDAGAADSPAPDLPHLTRPKMKGVRKDDPAVKAWRQQQAEQQKALPLWWLDRMVVADHQLTERLTWLWHGHFATSAQKVKVARLMLQQNQTMRKLGQGDFAALAQAMIIDPAMLVWLDGNDNTVKAPNENLSREFMELFTLGHGHYSEDDVKNAARSLTGWAVNRTTGQPTLRAKQHDTAGKTLFGTAGDFDAKSFVTTVLAQPASAPFVIGRLWFRLVSTTPPDQATMNQLVQAYGDVHDVGAVLAAIARTPAFTDSATSMVKQPVEWLVGLLRALGLRPSQLEPQGQRQLAAALRGLGQVPFRPPSVGGWPAAAAWLTTGAALSRIQIARTLATAAKLPTDLTKTPTKSRAEAIRRLLGVDAFSARTSDAIAQVAGQLPTALALAACSPEYTVSA